MLKDFVHLHVHSEYSLLDGACRISKLPKKAKELGMKAIALTDHGAMFGVIDFYKECKKNDVKPIIGCEMYVAEHGKTRFSKEVEDKKYNHLILLAKNQEGYKNLCQLVSQSYTTGFYYKPRIDFELLQKHSNGLVCLSACLAGAVPQELLIGNYEKAKEIALEYKKLFGEDYYIEIQNNGIMEQVKVNSMLIQLARELNIPIVATNDTHYIEKGDDFIQEILLCIQTGKKLSDTNRMKMGTNQLYLKSPEEMIEYFENIPEAIENTVEIANKCNVEFEFGKTILPNFDVPQEFDSHYAYLKHLGETGLQKRYEDVNQKVIDRFNYELSVIEKMGYVDYFLIVWDFVNFAKSQKISVGPGRGSGAGSILAYSLGITDIDPLKYDLLFERFLNPERISMPDIDIDFDFERRQEVIDYVGKKYGNDHVSQIITFGTMAAKMVIRDVARVMDLPYNLADKVAKMVPTGPKVTIQEALNISFELKELYETDEKVKELIDIAKKLEGFPRNTSTHACGIVITNTKLEDIVPLYARDEVVSTQYIMTTLEELGLLKMDFLGLRTLTVIDETVKSVKENYGIDVDFGTEYTDEKVYEQWSNGHTCGIFQFESQGMTNFMKELKPDCLEDIIAGVSLYRPGPMDQIPQYIQAKKDKTKIKYLHESLEDILDVTYGCMVYQEQVMQIVRKLAGYSFARADLVRRAMGKKKLDVMQKEREIFVNGLEEDGKVVIPGCVRNGIPQDIANKIFDEMAEFAKYAFNKSHAACYAVIAYRTAFLKTYYPAEFMSAMLNSFIGNMDKIPEYIEECNRLNIEILRPNINTSQLKFFAKDNKIYYGLGSIKNLGFNIIEKILKERNENGEFIDFIDFSKRVSELGINKKTFEGLIKSGSMDCFEKTRATLLASSEYLFEQIQASNRWKLKGQISLFETENIEEEYHFIEKEEMANLEKLKYEKEYLGVYVTGNPLAKYKEEILKKTNYNSKISKQIYDKEINSYTDRQNVSIAGLITKINKKYTKNNKFMAIITIEDLYGSTEVICFENVYLKYSDLIQEDKLCYITGRLSLKEEALSPVIANELKNLEETLYKETTQKLENTFVIKIDELDEAQKRRLKSFIKFFANNTNSNSAIFIQTGQELKPCGNIYIDEFNFKYLKEIIHNSYYVK